MALLEGLGTAVPGSPVPQARIRQTAQEILEALAPDLLRHMPVFDNAGIRTRHLVRPLEWYLDSHGWADRMAVFREAGQPIAAEAARRALAHADVPPASVDGILLVCTTGLATPSLDAALVEDLGLRRDVQRIPLWGLGCAGGVAGLDLAADLARAHPRKRFLLVALETCSLAFNLHDLSLRAFVAATLFADGAAAALVRGEELKGARLGRLRPGAAHQWPGSRDVMGWDVTDEGLRVVFSRRIPDLVRDDLAPVVARYLKRAPRAPTRHPFHPGGAKVLAAYEQALGLPPEALDDARAVLRDCGNMSSPTVLFALQRALARPLAPEESALLVALGPGFTAQLALLEG